MEKVVIKTHKTKEVVDITDQLNSVIKNYPRKKGFCHLFLTHTTAALSTAYSDPKWELDVIDAFEVEIPKMTTIRSKYEHNHHIAHLPTHITASYIGQSLSIPYKSGKLILGNFQRVVLIELNGPRKREII